MWQTVLEVGPLPVFFDGQGHIGFPIKDAEVRAMIEAKDPRLFAALQTAIDLYGEVSLCYWFNDHVYADFKLDLFNRGEYPQLVDDLHTILNSPLASGWALGNAERILAIIQLKQQAQLRRKEYQRQRSKLLALVRERDGGARCAKCGRTDKLTLDHIVPLSKGGTNDPENLQQLCRSCNSRKGRT